MGIPFTKCARGARAQGKEWDVGVTLRGLINGNAAWSLGGRANGSHPGPDSCPKCGGLVAVRFDPRIGREAYCLNCGWTPLTTLAAHVVTAEEWRRIAELRRRGRALALAGVAGD